MHGRAVPRGAALSSSARSGRVTDWEGGALRTTGVTRVLAAGDAALLPRAVALLSANERTARTAAD